MGLEASCKARFDGKVSEGKAHLETDAEKFVIPVSRRGLQKSPM